jgi:hypothetical protein
MASLAMTQSQVSIKPDRAVLRAELIETRGEVQRWLNTLTDDQWRQKSAASAWTVAEVFDHLTFALEYLPSEVAAAKRGRGMFNFPKFLADPISHWSTRWSARQATPRAISRRYEAAMAAALQALEAVEDGEWALGADFYGEGFYSVADLFRTPTQHLAEHTAGLAAQVAAGDATSPTQAAAVSLGLGLVFSFALLSWLGEYVHNLFELPQLTVLSPENSLPALTTAVLVAVWAQRPLRRAGTVLLLVWAALHLVGGGLVSVLPLEILPFTPTQSLAHYAVHLLYGLAQLPLIVLMIKSLRAASRAGAGQSRSG